MTLELQQDAPGEEWIATLMHPEEYMHGLNQVAVLTNRNVILVKRKFISRKGLERVPYSIRECRSIAYNSYYAIGSLVAGMLAIGLIAGIVWGVLVYGARMQVGASVPIGAMVLVIVFGLIRLAGIRRHRLLFEFPGESLVWKSRAGQFKDKQVSIDKVEAFAREKGLWRRS